MKTVAFVPIRLNSKRVVGKNLKMLDGKPLLRHILDTLCDVKNIDEVWVYSSSDKILEYLPKGVKWLKRPEKLDDDLTLGKEIYQSFIEVINADIYVLAHTTSPFIKSSTIENAVGKVISGVYDSAFSAEQIQTFAWYKNTLKL